MLKAELKEKQGLLNLMRGGLKNAMTEDAAQTVGVGARGEQQAAEGVPALTDAQVYSPFCPHWAALHECEDRPEFMLAACARSCANVERLPHTLSAVLNESDPHTAISLTPAEVRAVLSLAPAMREHVDAIIRDGGDQPAWFAHEGGLDELTHGRRYRLAPRDQWFTGHGGPARPKEGAEGTVTFAAQDKDAAGGSQKMTEINDLTSATRAPDQGRFVPAPELAQAFKALEVIKRLYVGLPAPQQVHLRAKIAEGFNLAVPSSSKA